MDFESWVNLEPFFGISDTPPWSPPIKNEEKVHWMKRSSANLDPSPPSALGPQDPASLRNSQRQGKHDRNSYPNSPANRISGRTPQTTQRQQKRETPCMNQAWSNPTFDNSNASWEGWEGSTSRTPPTKNDSSPGGFYKQRNSGSYQSGSEWSPGESSASNSAASSYGMMHTPQQSPSSNSLSASSAAYYETNGFYGSGYNYGQSGGYLQSSYGQQHQYPHSVRTGDGSFNNGNRNPSSCPPVKPIADYQRRQNRYGLDGVPKVQIKREPEDYAEMDGENFTSLFTKSLTSLYSQETENAFPDEGKPYDPDIMICSPTPMPAAEQAGYQRLHSSGAQYPGNVANDYQDSQNNFGFYESRTQNCQPPPSAVAEDMSADGDRMNSFRYDRPSFDDMHLYASSANDTKAQAKKRKLSMPNAQPETGFTDNRKKTPRMMSFKSDSKWTPNSFAFSEIQIKQEPIDDYSTNELDSPNGNRLHYKDSSLGSNGNGNSNGKSPSQQPDHPKPAPRKRSPGATCFDRFDKKSTPTNKKVSPLSVYAKVQESIVLNVKCRRYKKRTKPISNKEEAACPGREEMENYKRSSLTPDQAARQVMSELVERVSLFGERSVIDGPDLTQVDAMKVRELLMQFCHRYSMDFRDFEDISRVLKPRLIEDKTAKNSERASAIRKRTSTSPVQPPKLEAEPTNKAPKSERGAKKATSEDSTPADGRVLRKLPGRVDRSRPRGRRDSKPPVVMRRYSTRSAKDVDEGRGSDVDIIIDSSTDRESEAGKEAEVRKKSQRLKNKQPVSETPARERSSEKAPKNARSNKREESCTRSREKRVEKPKEMLKPLPRKRSRHSHTNSSIESLRSSSIEIVDISKSDTPSPPDFGLNEIKLEPLSSSEVSKKLISKRKSLSEAPRKSFDKIPTSAATNKKSSSAKSCLRHINGMIDVELNDKTDTKAFPKKKALENSKKSVTCGMSQDIQSTSKSSKGNSEETGSFNSDSESNCPVLVKENDKPLNLDSLPPERSTAPKLSKVTPKKSASEESDRDKSLKLKKKDKKSTFINPPSKLNVNPQLSKEISKTPEVKLQPDSQKISNVLQRNDVPMDAEPPKSAHKRSSSRSARKKIQLYDPIPYLIKNIKQEPIEQTDKVNNKSDVSLNVPSSETQPVPENKRVVRSLPIKKIPRRRSSQHSESELRVVLTKLPDAQIDFKTGSVAAEVVKKCEEEEEELKPDLLKVEEPIKPSEDNVDLEKPPELVSMKEVNEDPVVQTSDVSDSQESMDQSVFSSSVTPVIVENSTGDATSTENIHRPKAVVCHRYSESEDSDCGLVIDLDRRLSVEERVPTPTIPNSETTKDPKKEETSELEKSSEKAPSGETLTKENHSKTVALEGQSVKASSKEDDPIPSTSTALDILRSAEEDASLLLHLSRNAVPPLTTCFASDEGRLARDLEEVAIRATTGMREPERDESILRTLLLDTSDVASGSSQDLQSQPGPSTESEDNKACFNHELMRYLMYQAYNGIIPADASDEEKRIFFDQLPRDINANIISEAESLGNDPKALRRAIQRLKHEIVYLKCMADQKARERTAIICYKRYKEEVLNGMSKYSEEKAEHDCDWEDKMSTEDDIKDFELSAASSSAASNDESCLLSARRMFELAYHATLRRGAPSATITSAESFSAQCGEILPTVATMVANATGNYGVNMRNVSHSESNSNILKDALSSRESICSPDACGSTSSPEPKTGQSVKIFQKSSTTTTESIPGPSHSRSPTLPELSPARKSSHRYSKHVFRCSSSSSQSPPSLQPEPQAKDDSSFTSTSSSFQSHYPLSLVVTTTSDVKTESSQTVHISCKTISGKSSPRSSPKRSSYSVWSSAEKMGRSSSPTATSVDLHTDQVEVHETTPKRASSVDHAFMVVPLPTTLKSSSKHSDHHRSRSEVSQEKSLNDSVEIYRRRTEEELRALSCTSVMVVPYGAVPSAKTSETSTINSPPRCMGCGISDAKFLCSGCRKHWYCSAQCQTLRWPEHSHACAGSLYNAGSSSSSSSYN